MFAKKRTKNDLDNKLKRVTLQRQEGEIMKKGDLIRNKNDGEFAVILSTFVKFFPDQSHGEFDSGVADTAVRVKWIEGGYEHTFQRSKMSRNWEVISESG